MALNNQEENQLKATQKLNQLQALFAPILSALSEDQRLALAKIDKKLFEDEEKNEFECEKKTDSDHQPINSLLKMELKHVDRRENPWLDNDICY